MPSLFNALFPLAATFDPVFILDDHGRIVSHNTLAEAFVHASSATSLVGRSLAAVLCPVHPVLLDAMLGAARQDLPASGDLVLEDQRTVSIRMVQVPQGTAVQVQDVTARSEVQIRSQTLLDLNAQLAGNHSTREVVQAVLERGAAVLHADTASVLRLSRDGESLEIIGSVGYEADLVDAWHTISMSRATPITDAVRTRQVVSLTSAETDEGYPGLVTSRLPGSERLVALPLVFGTRVLGGLTFSLNADRLVGTADQAFLQSLAQICGQAFERAQLFDAQQRELTERRASEKALLAERARLETVLDQLPVAVWIAEVPSGRLIAGNRAIESILRHPFMATENIDGYAAYQGFHPDGQPYLAQDWPLARTVTTGESVVGEEIEMLRGDGTPGTVSFNSGLIRTPEGTPLFAVVTGTDITARREMETQVKVWNEDLERQVADRTEQLQAANAELDAFAYSVSHDLRRPVRHIAGFVGLLRRSLASRLDPSEAQLLDTVERSTQAMNTMIDALLAFARLSNQAVRLGDVDLNELVSEVRDQLVADSLGRRVEWTVAPLPTVQADRTLLLFVLINLLSNAVKYTGTRDVARIEIGSEMRGTQLAVWIRDNGVGFNPKYTEWSDSEERWDHRAYDDGGGGTCIVAVNLLFPS